MEDDATSTTSREELRKIKADKKAAKRQLREAHRAENIAKALATQAKRDESLQEAAAEAAARAAQMPVPSRVRELVSDPVRMEAVRRCQFAIEAMRKAEKPPCDGGVQLPSVDGRAAGSSADALLHAMSKGAQTEDMFNEAATAGYVERKFTERALLIFSALREARRVAWAAEALALIASPSLSSSSSSHNPADSTVVSVGGGPGCCLYGYVLFEQLVDVPGGAAEAMEVKRSERKSSQTDGSSSSSSSSSTTTTTTTTITATSSSSSSSFSSSRTTLESWDFVARCWDPHLRRADACLLGDRGRLRSRQCDITRPMSAQASCDHRHAHGPGEPGPGPGPVGGRDHRHANEPGEPVGGGAGASGGTTATKVGDASDEARHAAAADELLEAAARTRLVVFSYVLTETRGRWEGFLREMYHALPPGALLLCAEPTDWQPKALLALLMAEDRAAAGRSRQGHEHGHMHSADAAAAPPVAPPLPVLRHQWLDVRTHAAPPSVLLVQKPLLGIGAGGDISAASQADSS